MCLRSVHIRNRTIWCIIIHLMKPCSRQTCTESYFYDLINRHSILTYYTSQIYNRPIEPVFPIIRTMSISLGWSCLPHRQWRPYDPPKCLGPLLKAIRKNAPVCVKVYGTLTIISLRFLRFFTAKLNTITKGLAYISLHDNPVNDTTIKRPYAGDLRIWRADFHFCYCLPLGYLGTCSPTAASYAPDVWSRMCNTWRKDAAVCLI
jgi:hypothetical protein